MSDGIEKLSIGERIALVQALWDSIASEVESLPLTEAQRQEIDRRLAAHRANPQAAIPWEQVEERTMQTIKIVVWEEEGAWLGYLQDYPDYWTQGETLDDLKEHLKDLYADVTGGTIPAIRRVEELVIP